MRTLPSFLAAAFLAAASLSAQGTVVDDGSFTISRDGDRIGREDFSVRHVPTNAGAFETLTRGIVVIGSQRVTVDLSADSAALPQRYQGKVVIDGRTTESYRAEVLGRRYSARATRGGGESARELILPAGTLVVEDGVLHLLGFVAARGGGAQVPAVVPSRGVVVTIAVEDAGADHVAIALQSVAARKFILREGTSGLLREVWIDERGRLLKVSIPAQRLVAVRDDAPRAAPR